MPNNYPSSAAETSEILKKFQTRWIEKEIDADGVEFCNLVAQYLKERGMTSSYVRNIFGELKRIETKGFNQSRPDFYLLRAKVAYATARAKERDARVDISLFRDLYEKAAQSVHDDHTFKNLVNFFEAIIAFHKAAEGK
jgi:CRISPR-associated protein Csm2